LIERLGDLSGSLSGLEDYLPGAASSQATRLRERVENVTGDLRQLREEIRSGGAAQNLHELLVEDYRDIAQSIAAQAESLRSVGISDKSSDGPSPDGPSSSELASPNEMESPSGAQSNATGGTATALMFFGGAALTAWFLMKESGQTDKNQTGSNREDDDEPQSPGDVVPAQGALIGQY